MTRASTAEKQRKIYHERVASGLCPVCGCAALEGVRTCERHVESRANETPVETLLQQLADEDPHDGW